MNNTAQKRRSRVDGGYGWAVVFGSFLTHFLLLGLTRCFGILYVALLRIFDESATKTATLSACFNTVRMLLGIIVGLIVAATGLLKSYSAYLTIACIFGIFSGGFHAQRMTVVSEFIPKHRLPDVVGVSIFSQGLGCIIGTPMAGYVKDRMGNYDVAFYVGGLGLSVASALFLLDYVIKNCALCKTSQQQSARRLDHNAASRA